MHPYFTIFGREIPYYGVLFFLGIFAAAGIAVFLCRKRNIGGFDLTCSAIFAVIGGVAGAKLLFLAISMKELIALVQEGYSWEIFIKGGFVFYGGLIGGIIGLYIYVKKYKLSVSDFFDVYAVVLPFGHALGRVGCFFSGCCYGMPYDGPISYTYTESYGGGTPLGIPLLPVQLIEAALLLYLFGVSLLVFFRYPNAKGLSCGIYMFSYPVIRFTLEFFRGDEVRGVALGLSTSQWISMALLVITLCFCFWKKKMPQENKI